MKIEERIQELRQKKLREKYRRPWYRKWWGILIILLLILFFVLAISFSLLVFRLARNPLELEKFLRKSNMENLIDNIGPNEMDIRIIEGPALYFLGQKDAPNIIVLFSDFTCPYCKSATEVIASLAVKHGDSLKIIVRDFPVISEGSIELALAARCAGEQGRYWPMYYKLFELQGSFSSDNLSSIASSVGVSDINTFSNCISSEKYLNNIMKDISDGQYLEVSSTPFWFVNGYNAGGGAIPFEVWDSFLNELKSIAGTEGDFNDENISETLEEDLD